MTTEKEKMPFVENQCEVCKPDNKQKEDSKNCSDLEDMMAYFDFATNLLSSIDLSILE